MAKTAIIAAISANLCDYFGYDWHPYPDFQITTATTSLTNFFGRKTNFLPEIQTDYNPKTKKRIILLLGVTC